MADREDVMFIIPPGTNVPAGEHPGYIDWAGEASSANPMTTMTRAVVRLRRSDHAALYREVDITDLLLSGKVRFNFKPDELSEEEMRLARAVGEAFRQRTQSRPARRLKIYLGIVVVCVLGLLIWYFFPK
jgi:hypothetical protein